MIQKPKVAPPPIMSGLSLPFAGPNHESHIYIKNDNGIVDQVLKISTSDYKDSVEVEFEHEKPFSSYRF